MPPPPSLVFSRGLPLPSKQDVEGEFFNEDSSSLSAYDTVLSLERSLPSQHEPTLLMYARVVGYLLIYAPNQTAHKYVADEVNSYRAQEDPAAAILDLGKVFVRHFIRIFKNPKTRTPAPSPPSFNPSTFVKNMKKGMITVNPRNHKQARRNALIRDNYRCVLTGAIDLDCWTSIKELGGGKITQERAGKESRLEFTESAHILPESGIGEGNEAASSILSVFGYDYLLKQNINQLGNILTLSHTAHETFDSLMVWFEKTDTENMYKIGAIDDNTIFRAFKCFRFVKFTTTNTDLALPSVEYLSLHAAAAKVAHLSGATRYLDYIYRSEEELDALSSDESSAEILDPFAAFDTNAWIL